MAIALDQRDISNDSRKSIRETRGVVIWPSRRKHELEDDRCGRPPCEIQERLGCSQRFWCSLGSTYWAHHPNACGRTCFLLSGSNQSPMRSLGLFWVALADLQNLPFEQSANTDRNPKRAMPAIVLPDLPVPIWGFSLHFINDLLSRVFHDILVL